MSTVAAPPPRVPPIKLLGARRAFVSLGIGALLGPIVGAIVSLLFLPIATTASLRSGLVIMSVIFGLLFGPMLTLGAASTLAVSGFTNVDFASVGLRRLALFTALGCAAGIAIGFAVGAVLGPSSAITFMFALIGGIVGAVIPTSVLVGRAAKQRRAGA